MLLQFNSCKLVTNLVVQTMPIVLSDSNHSITHERPKMAWRPRILDKWQTNLNQSTRGCFFKEIQSNCPFPLLRPQVTNVN